VSTDNLTPIPKQIYYDGQLLAVEDFTRERDYHAALRELQTRLTCTPGVLTGLSVAPGAPATAVTVAAGVAIDTSGRLIMLVDAASLHVVTHSPPADLPLTAAAGGFTIDLDDARYYAVNSSRVWRLTIAFWDEPKEPARNFNQANQKPQLNLIETTEANAVALADPNAIALADLTVTATTAAAPEPPQGQPKSVPAPSVHVEIASVARQAAFMPALIPPLEKISGTLTAAQLPEISTLSGKLKTTQLPDLSALGGVLADTQLPQAIPAEKISGTLNAKQLPEISTLSGKLKATQLPDLSALGGVLADTQLPPHIPADRISGPLSAKQLPEISTIAGTLTDTQLPPHIPADRISGPLSAKQLPDLSALAGTLTDTQLPQSIPADRISGTLSAKQLPEISTIAGTLTDTQLPPHIPAEKISGPLAADQLPAIPPDKIAPPLTAAQIPLLAELLRRVQALEARPDAPATLTPPVTRGLELRASGLEAYWSAVPGAQQYDIELQSEPHLAGDPRIDIVLAQPPGQPVDPAHPAPLAQLSGVLLQPGDVLTFRVRAVAGALVSAWSDDIAGSRLTVPAPAVYADILRAADLSAQEAAARIAGIFGTGLTAADMLALLTSRFAASMASAAEKALALANAGYTAASVASLLMQNAVGSVDLAAALRPAYPALTAWQMSKLLRDAADLTADQLRAALTAALYAPVDVQQAVNRMFPPQPAPQPKPRPKPTGGVTAYAFAAGQSLDADWSIQPNPNGPSVAAADGYLRYSVSDLPMFDQWLLMSAKAALSTVGGCFISFPVRANAIQGDEVKFAVAGGVILRFTDGGRTVKWQHWADDFFDLAPSSVRADGVWRTVVLALTPGSVSLFEDGIKLFTWDNAIGNSVEPQFSIQALTAGVNLSFDIGEILCLPPTFASDDSDPYDYVFTPGEVRPPAGLSFMTPQGAPQVSFPGPFARFISPSPSKHNWATVTVGATPGEAILQYRLRVNTDGEAEVWLPGNVLRVPEASWRSWAAPLKALAASGVGAGKSDFTVVTLITRADRMTLLEDGLVKLEQMHPVMRGYWVRIRHVFKAMPISIDVAGIRTVPATKPGQ
jgi:hypothetical protein